MEKRGYIHKDWTPCIDPDTEVLTKDGWKQASELAPEDKLEKHINKDLADSVTDKLKVTRKTKPSI